MKNDATAIGLGLESSCDETAAAVVRGGTEVLSNCVYSQIALHKSYFGVVPEIASRAHLEVINELIRRALLDAGAGFEDLSYVSVTQRPGLVGSLLIGLQSAKAISFARGIPLIPVNHLEAHLYAPFLEGANLSFPYIGLLVSGGNTALYRVDGIGELTVLGRTLDDAVGEAFDKVAKFLDLEYPGGPVVERLARRAKNRKILFPKILPDPEEGYRFSYSGLKTAVINYIRNNPEADRADIVYSFQERALELLARRLFDAARKEGIRTMVVAGGVAANGRLRELLRERKGDDETILIPSAGLCTDNAAMVAGLGFRYWEKGFSAGLDSDVYARG